MDWLLLRDVDHGPIDIEDVSAAVVNRLASVEDESAAVNDGSAAVDDGSGARVGNSTNACSAGSGNGRDADTILYSISQGWARRR